MKAFAVFIYIYLPQKCQWLSNLVGGNKGMWNDSHHLELSLLKCF